MPLTLGAWLHDLSPYVFQLPNGWGLRWYGVSYALGFLVGWLILRWMAGRGMTPVPRDRVTDLLLTLVVGVVVGGRLGYVLFYDQKLLWTFTSDMPWWGLLAVNQGGMSSHGGMIGVFLATLVASRGFKTEDGGRVGASPPFHVIDLAALACTPGLLFGRIANFINGELLGRVVAAPGEPAPWWSVKFPQERFEEHLAPVLTPDQQHAMNELLAKYALPGDDATSAYQRVVNLLERGGSATSHDIARELGPLISARYPSQLLQGVAEGVLVGLVLFFIWRRPRRPGVIVSWFVVVYGIGRITTEALWRLPDLQLKHPYILGLSRGQWLSVVMVLLGVGVLAWVSRPRKPEPLKFGGWGVPVERQLHG